MDVARATSPDASRVDQRVFLHDVSWQAYEALLAWRGESSGVRITYLEGELELMTPSIDHESLKKQLARILEAWADLTGIMLEGAGSWTVKLRKEERGAEPDECYFVGPRRRDFPDIAIEVVWTAGGIDKLEVWRKLGAREVWIWESGELTFHALRGDRYVRAANSVLLPSLDPALVVRCMGEPSQTAAVRRLRQEMAPKKRTRPTRPRAKR
jgi:Uma2 family endonuclease